MTDSSDLETGNENSSTDEAADAKAAFAILALAVLGGIHFVYTGGLPAFLADFL